MHTFPEAINKRCIFVESLPACLPSLSRRMAAAGGAALPPLVAGAVGAGGGLQGIAAAGAGGSDTSDSDDAMAPPDMGPAPVGAKRRRKHKELSHEELVALKAERLKQFEGLVSQPAYLAMDKSSAARLNYADTGALYCQACKCTLSAMGGTGNIYKHLKNDKYVSMTSRCNTHMFYSAEWPSSTGTRETKSFGKLRTRS